VERAAGGGATSEKPTGKTASPPRKPESLPAAQSELWDELSSLLAGVVTDRDASMLMEACWWWAELRRVQAVLRGMVPGEKGYKDTLIGAGICTTNLDRILCRFGLTPADRAKLKAETSGPPVAKVATRPKTRLDAQGPPK
jgi:phage terminase small subunit